MMASDSSYRITTEEAGNTPATPLLVGVVAGEEVRRYGTGGRAVPSSVTEIPLAGGTTAPVLLATAGLLSSGGATDPVSLAVADNMSGMLSSTVLSSDPHFQEWMTS